MDARRRIKTEKFEKEEISKEIGGNFTRIKKIEANLVTVFSATTLEPRRESAITKSRNFPFDPSFEFAAYDAETSGRIRMSREFRAVEKGNEHQLVSN